MHLSFPTATRTGTLLTFAFASLTRAFALLAFAFTLSLPGLPAQASSGDSWNPEDPPWGVGKALQAVVDTADVQHTIGDTTMALQLDGSTFHLPYYSNLLLDQAHPGITRAVVVIHGTLRNADDYYNHIINAEESAPGADSTTLVIAPQFLTEADVAADSLPDSYLFWAYMGWRQGDASLSTTVHPRTARISSFAVVDTILTRLAVFVPNLERVVVAGHSAGGQFTNRYAAGNRVHGELVGHYGIAVRYIIANPSSYLYFDPKRWVPGSLSQYAVPSADQQAACPNYNRYKYGLLGLNPYMDIGADLLRAQYASRECVCLLGGEDIDPYSAYLERNCEAMLEGEFRFQRGLLYRGHLIDTFGAPILNLHSFNVVPGVGHDARLIFQSTCGVFYLFDAGSCQPNLPTSNWEDRTTLLLRATSAHAVSWGDYNGDLHPDLYLSAADGADKLLRNDPSAGFVDATTPPLNDPQNGLGAAWVDTDEDFDLDLYTVNWRASNRLLRNDGGSFSDQTSGPLGAGGDLSECAWSDYDRDGDLDLFLARVNNEPSLLLRNDGPSGFVDVTPAAMIDTLDSRDASWADFDNDGDPDLFVANSNGPNRLFQNDGGAFVDVATSPITGLGNSASSSWGDYDNDGDLDLFLVNRSGPCRLYRNDVRNGFSEVISGPLSVNVQGRSACWLDFDNDGDLDLYLTNGLTKNRLFRNDGGDGFSDVTEYPINDAGMGVTSAWTDYDDDGRLDLYLAADNEWNKLFRNNLSTGNHWLEVELRGVESNSHGVGARVRVVTGTKVQLREVGSEAGCLGQDWPAAHFGLGTAATVDSLQIYWPSGIVQLELPGFLADRRLTITESNLPAGSPSSAPGLGALRWAAVPNPFREWIEFRPSRSGSGPLDVRIFDASGRLVRVLVDPPVDPAIGSSVGGSPDAASLAGGFHRLRWDALDELGRPVASGVYFCRISIGRERQEVRVHRVR